MPFLKSRNGAKKRKFDPLLDVSSAAAVLEISFAAPANSKIGTKNTLLKTGKGQTWFVSDLGGKN